MWSVSTPGSGMHSLLLLSLFLYLLQLLALVYAADVYVDDESGSVSYSTDHWAEGNGCSSCALQPNPSNTYGNSWHDTTYYWNGTARTITLNFTGVAISAYFIVPDQDHGDATVDMGLIFTLDGSQAGTYTHTPSGGSDFLYKQQLFSKSGLSNSTHSIVVSASASNGESTAVLFDYFVYTTANGTTTTGSSSSSSSNPSSGATVTSSGSSNNGSSLRSGSLTGGPSSASTGSSIAISGNILSGSSTSTGSALPSGTDTPSSSSHHSVGAIAGGVVGGILGFFLILLLLLCCRRRARRAAEYADDSEYSPTRFERACSRICMRSDVSSLLAPHPVVFEEDPMSPQTYAKRGSSHNLISPYNEKGRPFMHQEDAPRTAQRHADGMEPQQRASFSAGSQSTGASAADILSQVAAIQAAVLSLQEQRMNGRHVDVGGVELALAPPAYSRRT